MNFRRTRRPTAMKNRKPEREARYRRYLEAERQAVALYVTMAEVEKDSKRAQIFRQLAEAEQRHVSHWAAKLGLSSSGLPPVRPGLRLRLLGWLARHFGTSQVLPLILRIESADTEMYASEPEGKGLMAEEEGQSQVLRDVKAGRYPGSELTIGGWRKAAAGGALRAAVLGGNDGLVSTFALVWGVAGGTSNPQIIMLAGVAGLLAGSFSMAAGEYVL